MQRLLNRSGSGSTRTGVGALVGALLVAATALVASPAGASNQSIHFSVTRVAFGAVDIGTAGSDSSIVTNHTGQPLYFVSATPSNNNVGAEYHGSAGTCIGALAPTASCDVAVVFAPNEPGLRASSLAVTFAEKNAGGTITSEATVNAALFGRGVLPTFTLSNANAGNVMIGQTGTEEATITNTSYVPLKVHSWSLQGVVNHNFVVTSNACPSPVQPGGSCGIVLAFSPHRTGSASATLTVKMLVPGDKESLVARQSTIKGTGVVATGKAPPPFELSAIDFGTVTVGTTATGISVLTNTGKHNETFVTDSISSGAPAFAVTGNNCPSPIVPGASCDLTVTFSPAAAGTHNATLNAQATFVNSKLVTVTVNEHASLTGKATNPTFSLSTDKFPATTVGATSDGLVTITNTSLVSLNYDTAAFQGADQSSWSIVGNSCSSPILSGASCSIEVAFTPRSQGALAITLAVTLDQTVRGHESFIVRRIALVGHGVLPTFKISAPSLPSTPKGVPVSGNATLTNTSSVNLSFHGYGFMGTNAADFTVTGSTCSGLIAPAGTCDLTIQFKPSRSTPGSEHATLKVVMNIAGTSPLVTTAKNAALSGTES